MIRLVSLKLGERTRWWVFLWTAAKGSLCHNSRFGPNSGLGDRWLHRWGNGYAPSGQATDDDDDWKPILLDYFVFSYVLTTQKTMVIAWNNSHKGIS